MLVNQTLMVARELLIEVLSDGRAEKLLELASLLKQRDACIRRRVCFTASLSGGHTTC
jgi:hypothetical protein